MTYRKIGGLHFLRIGRVQLMFCLCRSRHSPARRQRDRNLRRALAAQTEGA